MTASIAAASGLKALPGPTGRGMHGRASVTSKATQLIAERTLSKMRSYFYLRERLTAELPNTIRLVRCNVSYHTFSQKRADVERQPDFGLKPQQARLTTGAEAPRLAAGSPL